jgi:hypothetical protein
VSDWYGEDYYAHAPARNPTGPASGTDRVVRGGSWGHSQAEARAAMRGSTYPADDCEKLGFRVVTTAPAPDAKSEGPATTTTAVAAKPIKSVLFVGDSFSSFLKKYFPRLAASATPPRLVDRLGDATGDGYPLRIQWQFHRPDDIKAQSWDAVVLEEDLVEHWPDAAEFVEYARKFDEVIKQTGARTVLYMPPQYGGSVPPTVDDIAAAYGRSATELGAKVAPFGLAVQRAMKERPDLNLGTVEGYHTTAPTLSPHAFYLAMCVLYATLFDESPVGLPYRMADVSPASAEGQSWGVKEGWAISEADAAYLQKVAWDTVTEYNKAR